MRSSHRRFHSWQTSLRSSGSGGQADLLVHRRVFQLTNFRGKQLKILRRSRIPAVVGKVFSLAPAPFGGCLHLVANQCVGSPDIFRLPLLAISNLESNCDSLKAARRG
jgi:hypothetical protein